VAYKDQDRVLLRRYRLSVLGENVPEVYISAGGHVPCAALVLKANVCASDTHVLVLQDDT